MPKTNHQRDYREIPWDVDSQSWCQVSELADKVVGASAKGTGWDATCGKPGVMQDRRGAKKFVRSRIRFHENHATQKLLLEYQTNNDPDLTDEFGSDRL